MIAFFKILALFSILLLFTYNHSFDMDEQKEQNDEFLNLGKKTKKKIVLLGASIGKSWNIPSLSGRIKDNRYVFEYIHGGGSDKSKKLKEIIPRQMFEVSIQAACGGKIISRENIPARKKDVTQKLYGGDRTRKDKLLKKQAAGKRKLKTVGKVNLPNSVFIDMLR